jgi:hypothetical protein
MASRLDPGIFSPRSTSSNFIPIPNRTALSETSRTASHVAQELLLRSDPFRTTTHYSRLGNSTREAEIQAPKPTITDLMRRLAEVRESSLSEESNIDFQNNYDDHFQDLDVTEEKDTPNQIQKKKPIPKCFTFEEDHIKRVLAPQDRELFIPGSKVDKILKS